MLRSRVKYVRAVFIRYGKTVKDNIRCEISEDNRDAS